MGHGGREGGQKAIVCVCVWDVCRAKQGGPMSCEEGRSIVVID